MSAVVDEIKVKRFAESAFHAVQQEKARLIDACMRKDTKGEMQQFARLESEGSMDAMTIRHEEQSGDDPLFTVRWAVMNFFKKAYWLDKQDEVEVAIADLSSPLMRNLVMLGGRKVDDVILAALGGSALEGKAAGSSIALPSAQQVAVSFGGAGSDVGLNREKLVEAKRLLDASEVPEDDRHGVISSREIAALLNDDQFTSSEFRTLKALESGDVVGDKLLGFQIHRSERLPTSGGDNLCYFWHKDGLGLSFVEQPFGRIDEINTRNYLKQIYYRMGLGAVRVEDTRVVEVACNV